MQGRLSSDWETVQGGCSAFAHKNMDCVLDITQSADMFLSLSSKHSASGIEQVLSQLLLCRAVLSCSDSSDAWDGGSVGTPCPVSMAGGSWRLYYSGRQSRQNGSWGGIGMALTSNDDEQFEGIKVSFKRGRQA